jgi:high-affinity iron transporter
MGAAFLITLREGLEAALIVAIVLAYLRQLGRQDQFAVAAGGAVAGVAVSVAAGAILYVAIGGLEGRAEHLTEAFIALAAVAVLTWMIFWMRGQARSLGGELRSQVDQAIAGGSVLGLTSIVFIGVVREGLETALFLIAVIFDSGALNTAIGALAGLAVASVLGYAFYRGGQLINLRLFFQVTGGLIIIVAAGLLGKGIFQLQAEGVFNSLWWPVWDLTNVDALNHSTFAQFLRGLFGWNPEPSIEQIIAYVGYVVVASWFFFHGRLPASFANAFRRSTSITSEATRTPAPATPDNQGR